MFDKSPTWQRFSPPSSQVIRVHMGHVPDLESAKGEDKTGLRIALVVTVLLHVALLALQLPADAERPEWKPPQQKVFAMQQVRFQPPPPQVVQQLPKNREKRRIIPIPDPTPDDLEPLRNVEIEVPEIDFELADLGLALAIPEAPPGPATTGSSGPLEVGGEVSPPVRVYAPAPPYTDLARQGRVQGVVILEAIIDAMGHVDDVKILKGLPLGLSESALQAASEWTFEPALKNGRPVPVFFTLTIRFSLQ